MPGTDGSTELPQPNIEKDSYLSRLGELDRKNLERVTQLFEEVIRESGENAALLAVGGSLIKPMPRPDIDLIVVFDENPSAPKKEDFQNNHLFSLEDFKILQQVVEGIVNKDPEFELINSHEPEIDWEYGNPNILRHDGSILLSSSKGTGTPFEFIRMPNRGNFKQLMTENSPSRQRPYVLLADAKSMNKAS